jgi:phosphatidate cytidylyltransferase
MAAPAEPTLHWSKKPLTLRIISAAVLIPIVVAAVYAGHPAWTLLVILFAGVMAWEWSNIVSRNPSVTEPERHRAIIATVLLVVGIMLASAFPTIWPEAVREHSRIVVAVAVALFVGATGSYNNVVTRRGKLLPSFRWASFWFVLGFLYVSVPCFAIIDLRADPIVGLPQILWIVALVIAADTGAYIAGRSIGGPKLAPRISPNKTWAGLGGAVVSAAVVGAITALLMDLPSVATLTVVSGGLGIVAQAGDLAESAFKRHFGVKDASNIIPGHGGALDRVDGLIAVAAAVAGINYLIGSSVLTWL